MKNPALLTALFVLSILLPMQSYAQSTNEGYLIIKIYESIDMRYNKIVVTERGNKIEQLDLARFASASIEANQILINNTFDKYKAKGYKLISTTAGSQLIASTTDVLTATYLFEKE